MALVIPVSRVKKRALRSRNTRLLRGLRPDKTAWTPFYKELAEGIVSPLREEIKELMPFFLSRPPVPAVQAAIFKVQQNYSEILDRQAMRIASEWVYSVSDKARKKLEASIGRTLGVDYAAVIDSPNVMGAMLAMSDEATQLIKTIPRRYLYSVQDVILESYMQERLPENRSLPAEIEKLGHVTFERAKVIARDQTHKIHSAVEQVRQTDLGIEEYIWRTALDQRVVGDPTGLYPKPTKLHGDHYIREGKIFRWDSPPSDGHPGWPIQCRCYAEAVIDTDKIIAKASYV